MNADNITTRRQAIAAVRAEADAVIEQLARKARGFDRGMWRDDVRPVDRTQWNSIHCNMRRSVAFAFELSARFANDAAQDHAAQDHAAQHCTCDAAAGAAARREAIANAQTEDDYLSAGESHWSEYVEPCAYCARASEADAAESFAAAVVAPMVAAGIIAPATLPGLPEGVAAFTFAPRDTFEPAVILEPIIRTDKRTGAPRVRWVVRNAWTGDYLRSICALGGPVREYATPERAEAAGLVAFGPRTQP